METSGMDSIELSDNSIDAGPNNNKNEGRSVERVPYEEETRVVRLYLRMYFNAALTWTGSACSFHLIYCFLFLLQIIKVSLITAQIFVFGADRANFTAIVNRGHIALRHTFLEGWTASFESLPYPPVHGEFAAYGIQNLEDRINFAVEQFYNIEQNAAGYYYRMESDYMTVRIKHFQFTNDSQLSLHDDSFPAKDGIVQVVDVKTNIAKYSYNIQRELEKRNHSQPLHRLVYLLLDFNLHAVRVFEEDVSTICLSIKAEVSFRDFNTNGQVVANLETLTRKVPCRDLGLSLQDAVLPSSSKSMGGSVIALCVLSMVTTVSVMLFALLTLVKTKRYMRKYYQWFYMPVDPDETDLPYTEYLKFFKVWDINTFLADILTIYATVNIVFTIEEQQFVLATLDSYTVALSVGGFLAWISLLRFFKFHDMFHILFSTIYRGLKDAVAYMACVAVIFVGFWACGYVVLNPYHVKFQTTDRAAETLFSVITGDELFITLNFLEKKKTGSDVIYWFSRIYITAYVAVFVIVVINVLIAIFLNAYESIKQYYETGSVERTLGPVERTLQRYLTEDTSADPTHLRASVCGLMRDSDKLSGRTRDSDKLSGQTALKRELSKLLRICDNRLVPNRPRTLKAFYSEHDGGLETKQLCCMKCSFLLTSAFKKKL